MNIQTATTIEQFVERAQAAWETEKAAAVKRQGETEAGDLLRIWNALEDAGVVPDKTRTVRNRDTYGGYGSERLVPVTEAVDTRAWTDDDGPTGYYQPAVAATIRHGEVWILAEHLEEPETGHYLPVGQLTGLETIGQALSSGGHSPWTPPTVDEQVTKALTSVSGDYINSDNAVVLSSAEAICAALLDVAAAIREGRNA